MTLGPSQFPGEAQSGKLSGKFTAVKLLSVCFEVDLICVELTVCRVDRVSS